MPDKNNYFGGILVKAKLGSYKLYVYPHSDRLIL